MYHLLRKPSVTKELGVIALMLVCVYALWYTDVIHSGSLIVNILHGALWAMIVYSAYSLSKNMDERRKAYNQKANERHLLRVLTSEILAGLDALEFDNDRALIERTIRYEDRTLLRISKFKTAYLCSVSTTAFNTTETRIKTTDYYHIPRHPIHGDATTWREVETIESHPDPGRTSRKADHDLKGVIMDMLAFIFAEAPKRTAITMDMFLDLNSYIRKEATV